MERKELKREVKLRKIDLCQLSKDKKVRVSRLEERMRAEIKLNHTVEKFIKPKIFPPVLHKQITSLVTKKFQESESAVSLSRNWFRFAMHC